MGHFNSFCGSVELGARPLHNTISNKASTVSKNAREQAPTASKKQAGSGEPNWNRKPEPSEPFFQEPKAEPEPPEPFFGNRNRNRNRRSLVNSTETQEKFFFSEEPPEPKPEPVEPFHPEPLKYKKINCLATNLSDSTIFPTPN